MKEKTLTKQQQKSMQVKESIFKAAVKLLKGFDYDYLTVRNICAEADVSTGTFYHHFKNKDDLLSYYLSYGYEHYIEEHPIEITNDVTANIQAIYRSYIKYCLEMGIDFLSQFYSVQNQSLNTYYDSHEFDKKITPILQRVIDAVKSAQNEGQIDKSSDFDEIINDVAILVKGCIFEWCLSKGRFDLEERTLKILKFYFSNIVFKEWGGCK